MKKVNLYISCEYDPYRKFGYRGYTLEFGKHRKTDIVYRDYCMTNELYLEALYEALVKIKEPCEIFVCSTNDYVNNMVKYFSYYEKNGWKTKAGKGLKDEKNLKKISAIIKEKSLKLFSIKKEDKELKDKVFRKFIEESSLKDRIASVHRPSKKLW